VRTSDEAAGGQRDQTRGHVSPGLLGVAKDLERTERIHLIDTVEDGNVDPHTTRVWPRTARPLRWVPRRVLSDERECRLARRGLVVTGSFSEPRG